jgi:Ca2+-binding RTX toxin-like protein
VSARLALAALAAAVLGVAGASADPSLRGLTAPCAFDPATGTLSIAAEEDALSTVIVRDGEEILVTDPFGFDQPCAGPTPTITNTDLIDVRLSSFITIFTVDLRAGAFAPGASPEEDGSPEIEIRAKLGVEPILELLGADGGDRIALGRVPDSDGALNLNAGDDSDADLVFRGNNEQLQAYLGSGNDRFTAGSSRGFARPYRTIYFVDGDTGRDRLLGGPGRDGFSGDRDPDRLAGRAGRDSLIADRGGADRVACGSGRDYARVDRRDRVSGCERAD